MAIDKVTSAALATGAVPNQSAFKNIVINGDMSIAQRSTSVTGKTDGGYLTCDRWNVILTTAGTYSISQSSDNPDGKGFAKSMKFDCTTADGSLAAGDNLRLQTKFEGQNLQYLRKGTGEAQSLALSFWVKSNKTGTYIVELEDKDNTRKISNSYTINVADTWEKKTLTYDGDTTGAFNNDANRSLDLMFWLAAGSTFSGGTTLNTSWGAPSTADRAVGQVNLSDSTSNEWYITGVQLEAGTSASDFEFLPFDVNLNRCMRYYNEINETNNSTTFIAGALDGNNGTGIAPYQFPISMRAAPTVTYTGSFNCYVASSGTNKTDLNIQAGTRGLRTLASSVTGSSGQAVHMDFASGAKIHLSAEL